MLTQLLNNDIKTTEIKTKNILTSIITSIPSTSSTSSFTNVNLPLMPDTLDTSKITGISTLSEIKNKIEKLGEIQKHEIFRIVLKNNQPYSINTNGIFINISIFPKSVINDIITYLTFCNNSDIFLNKLNDTMTQYHNTITT